MRRFTNQKIAKAVIPNSFSRVPFTQIPLKRIKSNWHTNNRSLLFLLSVLGGASLEYLRKKNKKEDIAHCSNGHNDGEMNSVLSFILMVIILPMYVLLNASGLTRDERKAIEKREKKWKEKLTKQQLKENDLHPRKVGDPIEALLSIELVKKLEVEKEISINPKNIYKIEMGRWGLRVYFEERNYLFFSRYIKEQLIEKAADDIINEISKILGNNDVTYLIATSSELEIHLHNNNHWKYSDEERKLGIYYNAYLYSLSWERYKKDLISRLGNHPNISVKLKDNGSDRILFKTPGSANQFFEKLRGVSVRPTTTPI